MKTTLLLSVLCAAIAVSVSITCGNDTCANDETCPGGSTACQCNLALYTNTGSKPAPNFTCDGGYFNVQVSKCWLEKNSYNSSNIRLNSTDAICLATRNITTGTAQMTVHRPLKSNDCNTFTYANATHVTYRNQLFIYAKKGPIITRNDVVMPLSCTYPLNINVTLNVTQKPVFETIVINLPGSNASYTAKMVAYKDSDFLHPLTDSDTVYVEDFIYIAVSIANLDSDLLKLKVVRLFASPDSSNTIQYDMLVNGCPNPDLPADQITVNENGVSNEARFTMKVFQISGSNTVLLTANLVLCLSNCTLDCSSQTRSVIPENIAGSVSMRLDATARYYDTSSASGFSMSWTLSALIFSWILVKLM